MYVKELWRYPVKSMAGESIDQTEVGQLGLVNDREVLVVNGRGHVVTSRTQPKLLGLRGTIGKHGHVYINEHEWNSPEALVLVRKAAGTDANLIYAKDLERFDILPLLVATDGAIEHIGFDSRRFRANIIVGDVQGLEERVWPNHRLRIGKAIVHVAQLRARCVMTTYDPDTLDQDLGVLKRIVRELGGYLALDCSVVSGGLVRVCDPVSLID